MLHQCEIVVGTELDLKHAWRNEAFSDSSSESEMKSAPVIPSSFLCSWPDPLAVEHPGSLHYQCREKATMRTSLVQKITY